MSLSLLSKILAGLRELNIVITEQIGFAYLVMALSISKWWNEPK